ncbi:AMP-binding protein [Sphingopyxis panaciterrae]
MNQTATARGPGDVPGEQLLALAAKGMLFSHWARRNGDSPALLSPRGNRSFSELNGNANRLLRHFREAGLIAGDGVALLCGNIPQFIETYLACQRGGLRLTPINWHLSPREAAYILIDCAAKAWVVQGEFVELTAPAPGASVLTRLTTGVEREGFASYARAIAAQNDADPDDPAIGTVMLYTSGTTGHPKGVMRKAPIILMPQREASLCDYRDGDLNLLCGPAYHGGPLTFDIAFPIASGIPILMMERFDAAQWLLLVSKYRVTHSHMVSTMFRRLLALPEGARAEADLSSLKTVFHGAAPTSPEMKRQMIGWFGPVLYEYYGATEASPGIGIGSEEWLRKPGSVGRVPDASSTCILDADGNACAPGEIGLVSFPYNPATSPEYFNAPDKNAEAFGRRYFSVGDLGYIDADNYLFLTGRSAEVIISGGVNIYPQEVDNALGTHPAVREVCTVGVPNEEWGEEVKAVVALADGFAASPDLERHLLAYAREQLASFKLPRSVDFVTDIPHSEAGKVQRAAVRGRYWSQAARQI